MQVRLDFVGCEPVERLLQMDALSHAFEGRLGNQLVQFLSSHQDDVRADTVTTVNSRQCFEFFQQFLAETLCVLDNYEYAIAGVRPFSQNSIEGLKTLESSRGPANDAELSKEQIHEFVGYDLCATQDCDQPLRPHLLHGTLYNGGLAYANRPGDDGNRVLSRQRHLEISDDFCLCGSFEYGLALSNRLKRILREAKMLFVHVLSRCCLGTDAKPRRGLEQQV